MSLPAGWRSGLTPAQVLRVEEEVRRHRRGAWRRLPAEHAKGYIRIYLPRRPGFGGWQYLHRLVMMYQEGRVLARWEHVHHDPAAPKDTTDPRLLEVMEEADHGRFHYGRWIGCGPHLSECPDCGAADGIHGCPRCGGLGVEVA